MQDDGEEDEEVVVIIIVENIEYHYLHSLDYFNVKL